MKMNKPKENRLANQTCDPIRVRCRLWGILHLTQSKRKYTNCLCLFCVCLLSCFVCYVCLLWVQWTKTQNTINKRAYWWDRTRSNTKTTREWCLVSRVCCAAHTTWTHKQNRTNDQQSTQNNMYTYEPANKQTHSVENTKNAWQHSVTYQCRIECPECTDIRTSKEHSQTRPQTPFFNVCCSTEENLHTLTMNNDSECCNVIQFGGSTTRCQSKESRKTRKHQPSNYNSKQPENQLYMIVYVIENITFASGAARHQKSRGNFRLDKSWGVSFYIKIHSQIKINGRSHHKSS